MRTSKEIDKEVIALRQLLAQLDRWSSQTREEMKAQVEALEGRMADNQVEDKWYEDEHDPEYNDGDNDIYHEVMRAVNWMKGVKDYDAPSKGAE